MEPRCDWVPRAPGSSRVAGSAAWKARANAPGAPQHVDRTEAAEAFRETRRHAKHASGGNLDELTMSSIEFLRSVPLFQATSPEDLQQLAQAAACSPGRFGICGSKDRRAVTVQRVSALSLIHI